MIRYDDGVRAQKGKPDSQPPEGEGYAVVALSQHNKQFSVWHPTLEEARAEAERLTSATNQAFCVVKLVGIVEPAPRPTRWKPVSSEQSAHEA